VRRDEAARVSVDAGRHVASANTRTLCHAAVLQSPRALQTSLNLSQPLPHPLNLPHESLASREPSVNWVREDKHRPT
jgi:hypothetical protein